MRNLHARAKSLAHANALFQGGFGGENDDAAVWEYAQDLYDEQREKLQGEINTLCDRVDKLETMVKFEAMRFHGLLVENEKLAKEHTT